jgi:small subunit ribosomal protein S20
MANHPSADKRNRQRVVQTTRNNSVTSTVRSAVKKARTALTAGDSEAAKAAVATASSLLARAASKGVLHDNAAARTTARIQSQLSKLSAR